LSEQNYPQKRLLIRFQSRVYLSTFTHTSSAVHTEDEIRNKTFQRCEMWASITIAANNETKSQNWK